MSRGAATLDPPGIKVAAVNNTTMRGAIAVHAESWPRRIMMASSRIGTANTVIARSSCDEAIRSCLWLLLRFARNDGADVVI
jgi:hypothetical protein